MEFFGEMMGGKVRKQESQSSPCAKRTGSCSGVSISAEGVERFGKIVDSKIIFWGL